MGLNQKLFINGGESIYDVAYVYNGEVRNVYAIEAENFDQAIKKACDKLNIENDRIDIIKEDRILPRLSKMCKQCKNRYLLSLGY